MNSNTVKPASSGFSLRFDHLSDFLITQGIALDQASLYELAHQYVGNNQNLRS